MSRVQRPVSTVQTPAEALQALIEEYQLTWIILAKHLKISYMTIYDILNGETKITCRTALHLAKYFKTTPEYWLNLQMLSDLNKLKTDQDFLSVLETIPTVKKPEAVFPSQR